MEHDGIVGPGLCIRDIDPSLKIVVPHECRGEALSETSRHRSTRFPRAYDGNALDFGKLGGADLEHAISYAQGVGEQRIRSDGLNPALPDRLGVVKERWMGTQLGLLLTLLPTAP